MKDAYYWITQLKNKQLSQQELIYDIEQKVKQLNPQLNALITFSSDEAIKSYNQCDNIEETLFLGLPVPLKLLGQNKQGWLDTSASRLFSNYYSPKNNYFVDKVESVGIIPLGQTNSPEFGFKNITDSMLHGVTHNPWQTDYSPGGSSGGAAAVVAAGIFPMAMASDGGGSIRIPASFCGLIGFKPSRGMMPVGPNGWRGWQGASINFGLTISMRDTHLLFHALKGVHPAAPYQPVISSHVPKKNLKIAYCHASPVNTHVSMEAKEALDKTVKQLEQLGHSVVEINYPIDGQQLIRSYYAMNGGETAAMFDNIERSINRSVTIDDMELMSWGIYQYGKKLPAASYVNALQTWDVATFQMERLFETYDVFLSPTTATTAPRIDEVLVSNEIKDRLRRSEEMNETTCAELIEEMFSKSLALTPYTQLANLTGQPAISLPVHVSHQGLPIGVQLMAARGNDELLLSLGKELESQCLFELPSYYS
ncbi:amidase [Vagococcus xieshaowenii]|uniref:Amidase n=1 Tax=Vagococcus xieshaowenii TaxID=2562451 RepID=A0A4Z0DDI3_9ENTE|nr:amidase [Vagococcus xieshaowenii]QCA28416.1 amidase [Vagococcus xieshaowenii]TFZ42828.1 amidase [Vagococcus xieshaowenii]